MAFKYMSERRQISQKARRHRARLAVILCAQHRIRPDDKAVDQSVQIMVIRIQHFKAAGYPRLQPGQFGEIRLILDLVMADQIAKQVRSHSLQPFAIIARRQIGVDVGLGVSTQHSHHMAKIQVPVQPERGQTVKVAVIMPAIAWIIGQNRAKLSRKGGAGSKGKGEGKLRFGHLQAFAQTCDAEQGTPIWHLHSVRFKAHLSPKSTQRCPMQSPVPQFTHSLTALSKILTKAQEFETAKKLKPEVIPNLRLIADMLPLWRQITIACDHAKGASARLSGVENPPMADTETTLEELQTRVANTLAFIATIPDSAFEGAETKTISLKAGPRELTFPAPQYFNSFALPNFFFHMSTAFGILRANGVEIGKTDFLGA
jgi:hypothetical protein